MPTGKRASKRVSLRKKYKIEKKVREHNREQRREARKNPGGKKLKKDPGVPNLWPLKEEFLHKLENYKAKLEQEKDRQKQQRLETLKKMREKKKAPSMQALAQEASQRDKEFEKREELEENENGAMWDVKDNSKRAYYREFKKIVEMSDVILEVLDARDPLGCRCPGVEQKILSKHPNKKIILILNKIDLVPRDNVEAWLKYLRNEFPTVAFKCSTQDQARNLGHSHVAFENASKKVLESSECLGADTLIQLLKNYCRNVNLKTSLSVGIIGYPNVGKSSLINSLKRSKAVGVGSTPGFTKTVQQIQLDKQIKLLDSPGIVFNEKSNDSDIVLRNAVKIEQIPDPIEPVELILKRCQKQQLMMIYEIANFETVNEFLIHISQKRGLLKKGGVSNMVAAARSVLQDWNAGKIAFYTIPPKNQNIHISAEIVQQWSKAFDVAALASMDNETISNLPQKTSNNVMAMAPGVSIESSELLEDEVMQDDEGEDGSDDEEEEEGSEEDAEAMTDEPVPQAVPIFQQPPQKVAAKQPPKKQALRDKEDKFNPQLNAQRKKDYKKQQKLKKKGKNFDWDDNSTMNDNNNDDVNNNDDDDNMDDMEDL